VTKITQFCVRPRVSRNGAQVPRLVIRGSVEGDRMAKLSPYAEKLSQEAKDRYLDKISTLGGVDPFFGVVIGDVCRPHLQLISLIWCHGLVLKTSFMTAKQFQARKGLEAYNQFFCGWVKDVKTRKAQESI